MTAYGSARTPIRKVTDYDGHIMEQDFPKVRDVISAHTARVMVELLRGVKKAPAFHRPVTEDNF